MTTNKNLDRIFNEIANLQQYVDEAINLQKSLDTTKSVSNIEQKAEEFLLKLKLKIGNLDSTVSEYHTNKTNMQCEEKTDLPQETASDQILPMETVNDTNVEKNNETVTSSTSKTETDSNLGKIKLKDISKLLDPNVFKNNTNNRNNNRPSTSMIVISDSDDENQKTEKDLTKNFNKNGTENNIKKKKKKSSSSSKEKTKKKDRFLKSKDASSTDDDGSSSEVFDKCRKEKNLVLRKKPTKKCTSLHNKDNVNSSNDDNSSEIDKVKFNGNNSDDSVSAVSSKSSSLRKAKKKKSFKKIQFDNDSTTDDDSDINYSKRNKKKSSKNVADKDQKFSWKCYIPLARIPAEELKSRILYTKELTEVEKLTNLESLKRKRRNSGSSVGSIEKNKEEKRIKEKNTVANSSPTQSAQCNVSQDIFSDTDELDIPQTASPICDTNPDIEVNLQPLLEALHSDSEKNEESDDGNKTHDTENISENVEKNNSQSNVLDKKENEANVSATENNEEANDMEVDSNNKANSENEGNSENLEKDQTETNMENIPDDENDRKSEKSEDEKEDSSDKPETNWRNNKLLREKLDLSDSDEDFASFCRKRAKLENEKTNDDEDIIIVKRHKRQIKKKAKNVLRSDSESDTDSSKAKVTSPSASSSSESEKDKEEDEEIQKKKPRRRVKQINDSSDEEADKSTRKQIRKVMTKNSLSESTILAEKEERERKERIAERQKRYNDIFEKDKLQNDSVNKVVLDFDEESNEELLSVPKSLVKHLKPHQGKGIQFMFDACFESLERMRKNEGSGCILAHCMGLGKTLQVIALSHTLLENEEKTKVSKILVVCPLSTVLNWVAEFRKWLPSNHDYEIFELVSYKKMIERHYRIEQWIKYGGVLILGYDMFRNLTNDTNRKIPKKIRNTFQKGLVNPGPDLVVCDEGHLLKNEKTSISIAMNKIRTLRRIVLTGTPLQNNLKEYYCMVQFVRPNLLGTYKEYMNRFVNPITNGQYTDSTLHDIAIMRKRSHVLHKMLDGIVQRKDYSVLAPFLPPKHEYVLFIKLTEMQIQLYDYYLKEKSRNSSMGNAASLFSDFQEFQRICTHPRVLLDKSLEVKTERQKREDEDEEDESEGSLKDFICDDSDEKSTSSSSDEQSNDEAIVNKPKRVTRSNANLLDTEEVIEVEETATNDPAEWWRQFCTNDDLDCIRNSGKLLVLFEILQQCEMIGDKLLIFSQSLYSLNVIEYFLGKIDEAAQNGNSLNTSGFQGSWSLGLDYFRLDGSSSCDNRALWCKSFNNPSNTRARLFLISTRAGGLGINLVAANRVIIFDVSWNPSHDIQSIYRVYRFGQTKPSYIYRFVTMGTMEMKIYERQVTKQAISKRVIDEQQIDRHYNQNDLQELYKFDPNPENQPTPLVPKDMMLAELLQKEKEIIFKYHEHQSLLENKEDEVLDEDERKAAWEEFENEKKMHTTSGSINNIPTAQIMAGIRSMLMRKYPNLTNEGIGKLLPDHFKILHEQLANNDFTFFNSIIDEIRRITQEQYYYRFQEQQRAAATLRYQQMFNNQNPMLMMQQFQQAMNAQASSSQNNINSINKPIEIIELSDEP